jgi:hypothetical protein
MTAGHERRALVLFSAIARGQTALGRSSTGSRTRINAKDSAGHTIQAACQRFIRLIIYIFIDAGFVRLGEIVNYSTDTAMEILQTCVCRA